MAIVNGVLKLDTAENTVTGIFGTSGDRILFPATGGGGSSVSYYFNGGTSQGTIGRNAY